MIKDGSIVLFKQKEVRRHWDDDKELWYFSVVDIIQILTETDRPRKYWNDLKKDFWLKEVKCPKKSDS
ncbi:MAG: hypothetical protein KatS3mg087_0402 [Patescibacteria group bacterium]|nr:MAG: hypothetical protein KatS3mg087_0402 [Patescibacteria group bacterium]